MLSMDKKNNCVVAIMLSMFVVYSTVLFNPFLSNFVIGGIYLICLICMLISGFKLYRADD